MSRPSSFAGTMLASLLAITTSCGVADRPTEPPTGTTPRIAFMTRRESEFDSTGILVRLIERIYTMKPDGTDQRPLTAGPEDESPAWSPDHTQLAFMGSGPHGGEIHMIGADGSGERRLSTAPLPHLWPGWSRDGHWVSYTRIDADGIWRLYAARPDGTGERLLSERGTINAEAAWDPLGRWIAYTSQRNGRLGVYLMPLNGGPDRRLTPDSLDASTPAWAPDGRRVAFIGWRRGGAELYLIRDDGTGVVKITSDGTTYAGRAAWAPDGSSIVYGAFRSLDYDIYEIKPDGSGSRNLTATPGLDADAAW